MGFFNNERRIFILSCLLALASLFAVAQAALKANASNKSDEFLRFSSTLSEVFDVIENKFVDDVEQDKLFEAAIQGMFLALDDHSQFLTADSYSQLNKETEGSFSGVGIHISMRNDVLTVIAPIPGSPAARLGVLPWDRIIKIEGEETRNITLQDAVNKLTGVPGTKVSITLYRPSENRTLDVTITRANVKVNSVYSRIIGGDIGYVRLTKFANDSSNDLKRALLSFHKDGARAIILDLRFNTGGLLKEAIDVSDLFLKKGDTIVSTKGREQDQNKVYKSEHEPITRLPTVVLVNNGSASASEIVAAALRDNNRAMLLGPKGQKTYGKWSVQTIEELRQSLSYDKEGNPRACAMRLTTARYYSPKGETFEGKGLPFDEEVELPKEEELNLFTKGGMLGDPSMIEPEESALDHFPTNEEISRGPGAPLHKPSNEATTGTATEADEATGVTTGTATVAEDGATTAGARGAASSGDLLLDHAVRALRTYIILEGKKAA